MVADGKGTSCEGNFGGDEMFNTLIAVVVASVYTFSKAIESHGAFAETQTPGS